MQKPENQNEVNDMLIWYVLFPKLQVLCLKSCNHIDTLIQIMQYCHKNRSSSAFKENRAKCNGSITFKSTDRKSLLW